MASLVILKTHLETVQNNQLEKEKKLEIRRSRIARKLLETEKTEEKRKELYKEQKNSGTIRKEKKIGRNDPCPCGSGKKYKKCCGK